MDLLVPSRINVPLPPLVKWETKQAKVFGNHISGPREGTAVKLAEYGDAWHYANVAYRFPAEGILRLVVEAKAAERHWLWITLDETMMAYFDLENGVVGHRGMTASIMPQRYGWWRCEVEKTVLKRGRISIGTAIGALKSKYTGKSLYGLYLAQPVAVWTKR